MMKTLLILLTISCFISGCNKSGPEGFGNLNITEEDLRYGQVTIENVTPEDELIDLTENLITFAVSIAPGAGLGVEYTFLFDGIEVQKSTSPFYILNTTVLTPRGHTLKVIASNPISSDEHIFELYKNTPPNLSHISNTAMSISCSGGSFNMQVVATDADNDGVTFSFLVNGVENAPGSSGTVASILATHTYTPPGCVVQGVQQVTIRATDTRGGVTDYTIAVNVLNPNVATITTFSPTGDPVTVKSTESVNFVVGATGAPPLTYIWSINPGGTVTRCADRPNCSISGGDFSAGAYVLGVKLLDSIPTEDEHSFNVIINAKPRITFKAPSSNNEIRMNCALSKNFQITFEDDNYDDPGQNMQVTWTLDGLSSNTIGVTTNTLSYPFTSTATFSPNCTSNLLGPHTLTVTISDGHEETSTSWTVMPNYFPDACNDILNDSSTSSRGRICTLAGLPGMGSGVNTATDPQKVKIAPNFLAEYDASTPNAYFMADTNRHVIWFYNGTSSPISVIGKTIAAKELAIILGAGASGTGTIGQSYYNFYLGTPRGMYYDRASDRLYIADHGNNRILVVGSDGKPAVFAGGGSSETDGALNTAHRCVNPVKILRINDDLVVSCWGSRGTNWGMVKKFSLTTLTGTTILKYTGNAAVSEGTLGIAGTGGVWGTWPMIKHPTEDVIFAADYQNWCRLYAINYGSTSVSFPGIALTVGPNEIKRLSSVSNCGANYGRSYTDPNLRIYPHSLGIKTDPTTGEFQGLYLVEVNYHFLGFLNMSANPVTISGRVTDPGFFNVIVGTGNPAYSRGAPTFTSTNIWSPGDILKTSRGQLFTDINNGRVSYFNDAQTSITNTVYDDLGFNYQAGYDGIENKLTTLHHLNTPTTIGYEPQQDRLLFFDSGNNRVRSIDLVSGEMDVVVGNGSSGQIVADPVPPLHNNFRLRNIRDFAPVPGENAVVFVDGFTQYNIPGPVVPPNTNNLENCVVRLWNFGSSTINDGGFIIDPNNVKSIVGDRAYGCANWNNAEYNGRPANEVALNNPQGIVYANNGDMYITNYYNHCIVKVNGATNAISQFAGLCGTAQDNMMGPVAEARFFYPGDMQSDPDPLYGPAGNFFVVDRAFNPSSSIKYVNNTNQDVNIFNLGAIAPNSVGRLVLTEGYTTGLASFDNQICYNQGNGTNPATTPHNIICMDRFTGLTTLRIGRSSASVVKGGVQTALEDEGAMASTALLFSPHGLTFDSEGNLYITESWGHTIRMVKKWW